MRTGIEETKYEVAHTHCASNAPTSVYATGSYCGDVGS
jgi:hypothetical protein